MIAEPSASVAAGGSRAVLIMPGSVKVAVWPVAMPNFEVDPVSETEGVAG